MIATYHCFRCHARFSIEEPKPGQTPRCPRCQDRGRRVGLDGTAPPKTIPAPDPTIPPPWIGARWGQFGWALYWVLASNLINLHLLPAAWAGVQILKLVPEVTRAHKLPTELLGWSLLALSAVALYSLVRPWFHMWARRYGRACLSTLWPIIPAALVGLAYAAGWFMVCVLGWPQIPPPAHPGYQPIP